LPLSLTKPIGTGVLNAWHKATGLVSAAAVDVMTTLNADASWRADPLGQGSGGSPLACMACAGACRRTGYQANDGSVGRCGPTEALQGGTGDWDDAG
jgi:hypothetical protein